MSEPVFLVGLLIIAATAASIVKSIAGGFSGRGARAALARVREDLDVMAAELAETQSAAERQAGQIAELHERVDFAERLLAQQRERPAIGPGDQHA